MASKAFYKGTGQLTLLSRAGMRMSRRLPIVHNVTQPIEKFNHRAVGPVAKPLWFNALEKFPPLPVPIGPEFTSTVHQDLRRKVVRRLQRTHPELFVAHEPKGNVAAGLLERFLEVYGELRVKNPERFQGLTEPERFEKLYRESYTLVMADERWSSTVRTAKAEFKFSTSEGLFNEYRGLVERRQRARGKALLKRENALADQARDEALLWQQTARRYNAMLDAARASTANRVK